MLLQPAMRPRRRRKFRPWNPTTYTVILLILAIVSVASWKVEEAGWLENRLTRFMSRPVRSLEGTRMWLMDIGRNIKTAIRVRDELATLRQEVEELRRENQELRIAAAESAHLRSLLDLPNRLEFHSLPAYVINRDLVFSKALIINRGREHGVRINQPVVSASEGLVGRIERVHSTTARVQLITDYNSVVGVRIDRKPLEAIVTGNPRDRVLVLSDLFHVRGANVFPEAGDRVLTSGIGRVFPPDVLVGHIESSVSDEKEDYRVVPEVDGRGVYEVLVLLGIDRREERDLLGPVDAS